MADSKISGLPLVAAFATTQELPVNDSGTSRKINGTQLIAAVAQGTGQFGSAAYAQVTANQGTFTTATDLTGLTVTVTTVTGRRYRVTGLVNISSSVANDICRLTLQEGATVLDLRQGSSPVANENASILCSAILTPSAAAHTYKLTATRESGTGNLTMQASTTFPAYILVEDLGV